VDPLAGNADLALWGFSVTDCASFQARFAESTSRALGWHAALAQDLLAPSTGPILFLAGLAHSGSTLAALGGMCGVKIGDTD